MADKLQPDDAASKSNVSDDTRRQLYREAVIARVELDKASGVYRAVLKRAKTDGVNVTAMVAAIVARSKDPDEVMMNLRDTIHMMAVTHMPTIQTDLFGMMVEPKVSEEEVTKHDNFRAKDDGHFNGAGGKPREGNPHHPGSEIFVEWDKGWLEGQAVLAQGPKLVTPPRPN